MSARSFCRLLARRVASSAAQISLEEILDCCNRQYHAQHGALGGMVDEGCISRIGLKLHPQIAAQV